MRNLIFSLLVIASSLSANNIYATFDVEASKSASLAFSSSGIIDKVFVDIGSIVKKGDKLAVLDNRDTQAILNIHQTTLKFAKKILIDKKRLERLLTKQNLIVMQINMKVQKHKFFIKKYY